MIKAMDTMQAGLLFQAIYEYQETGEEPPKGASIYPIFCLIRAKFEEDGEPDEKREPTWEIG